MHQDKPTKSGKQDPREGDDGSSPSKTQSGHSRSAVTQAVSARTDTCESLRPESEMPLSEVMGMPGKRAPVHDPLLGKELGGVRLTRLIAEGGMGRVYEGIQEKPKRAVAVKVMRPGVATPEMIRRFAYEAEILGRLRHPGIAHIFAAGVHVEGGVPIPFFIMEFIPDARSLTRHADDSCLSVRARLTVFKEVCDAVAHGHQKGVIHRDLKPGNILVESSGQPKVIDFGVAKVINSDAALTTMMTHAGEILGTLQYMAPEQLTHRAEQIDARIKQHPFCKSGFSEVGHLASMVR